MEPVILVIHLFLALGIIVLVLLQRSEGGGLGLGGGGLGGFSTARGTANALTKMTGIMAAGFFITSLTLGVLAGGHSTSNKSILDGVSAEEIQAPAQKTNASGIEYIPPANMNEGAPIDIQAVPEEKAVEAPVQPVEQPKPAAPVAE